MDENGTVTSGHISSGHDHVVIGEPADGVDAHLEGHNAVRAHQAIVHPLGKLVVLSAGVLDHGLRAVERPTRAILFERERARATAAEEILARPPKVLAAGKVEMHAIEMRVDHPSDPRGERKASAPEPAAAQVP